MTRLFAFHSVLLAWNHLFFTTSTTSTWPNWLELQNTLTTSLQRGKTPAIWWWGSSNVGVLKNVEHPFIAITPRSTLAWSGSTWEGPIYESNRTKQCNYTKLNCLKLTVFDILNYVLLLNWIVWNRTVLTFNCV